MAQGLVGTHSLWYFPPSSTYTRRNGASIDNVESHVRWKKATRVSDVYMGVNLPYPGAMVASILCVGGPCKYALKEGSGISEEWMSTRVVPSLAS